MERQIIEIEGIGKIECRRSTRFKRMGIRVEPMGIIIVNLTPFDSIESAKEFLIAQREWIAKTQKRLSVYDRKPTIFTPETQFATRLYKLRMQPFDKQKIEAYISHSKGEVTVFYPKDVSPENERIQSLTRKAISAAMKNEAIALIAPRVRELAKLQGLEFEHLGFRDMKSRWGSCESRQKRISLNVQLVRLPTELIDYVILHELCHLLHANHGPEFWSTLDQFCNGKARQLDKEVNKWSAEIY